MKKLKKIVILSTAILLLAGCGADQEKEALKRENIDLKKEIAMNNQNGIEQNDKKTDEKIEQIQTNENQKETDNIFQFDGNYFYGKITLIGYPVIKEVQETFCEKNCKTYSYVYFNILSGGNNAFNDFLKLNKGNSFMKESSVGLGCLENGKIKYSNFNDLEKNSEYSLNTAMVSEILKASKENPVKIELERIITTGGGRGAPTCYSHFAHVKLLN